MRFAEAPLLWTLAALPAVALLAAWLAGWRRRALAALGEPGTLRRLSSAPGLERRGVRLALLLGGIGLLALSLGRPQWGSRLEEVRRRGIDLVMVVDVSRSMLAQDVQPSRLQAAKEALGDLIDRLPGERIGLVAFSGAAHVFCPLTLDHAAARIFLDILDPSMIPVPGTALGAAIETGARLFDAGERKYKVMVIFTDGEDQDSEPRKAALAASGEGVVFYTIGVGTAAGEPIPLKNERGEVTDYVRDDAGSVVTSRLDEQLLEEIARASGGGYYPLSPGQQELDQVAQEIGDMDQKELSSRLATNLEDRFQWPLGAAILALALEAVLAERRRRARSAR